MSEDGLGRRGFLKSAGALLAGTSGASALRAKQIQKTHDGGNYTGIPEKYIDSLSSIIILNRHIRTQIYRNSIQMTET